MIVVYDIECTQVILPKASGTTLHIVTVISQYVAGSIKMLSLLYLYLILFLNQPNLIYKVTIARRPLDA